MRRKVRIYRSRPKGLKFGNFGDELSLPLLDRLLGVDPIPVPMQRADLLATGSILDAYARARWQRRLVVQMFGRREPLHVWGSGFMLEETDAAWPRPLKIHGVRGKLTAARLPGFSGSIGDPGILASQLVDKPSTPEFAVCLVPHFVDEAVVAQLELPAYWKVVHPDGDPISVISQIAKAELVISSSLHGLIVADSFGIPAVWARSTNDLHKKSDYKFHDHASARGRSFNFPEIYLKLTQKSTTELHSSSSTASRSIGDWQDDILSSFQIY